MEGCLELKKDGVAFILLETGTDHCWFAQRTKSFLVVLWKLMQLCNEDLLLCGKGFLLCRGFCRRRRAHSVLVAGRTISDETKLHPKSQAE